MYSEENFLMLSGIQHFAFCERQWALIHLEQQWQENRLTSEGKHLHVHVDNPLENDKRKNVKTTRSVHISSHELGLIGIADVIQYIRDDRLPENETVTLKGHSGRWKVIPIEYKRGRQKKDDIDRVQLCAQAMCLEEMLCIKIKEGFLFYYATKRRELVPFDLNLRQKVLELTKEMHEMFTAGTIPKSEEMEKCKSCSLCEICQPGWQKHGRRVEEYILKNLYSEEGK
jgi:CRISPR-associated exonuclease Cas4